MCVIAGDLLDGEHHGGLLPQMVAVNRWCRQFPRWLAISSGNHDGNFANSELEADLGHIADEDYRRDAHAVLGAAYWMDTLERERVVTDGRSALLETAGGGVIITTIPFFPTAAGPDFVNALWAAGDALRRSSGAPWLVLHHDPPQGTLVGGGYGHADLRCKAAEYRPDFIVSGHTHGQPYKGDFADKIGNTWCFNPGRPVLSRAIRAKAPNHIILDLAAKTATWHATPNVGRIPISRSIALG